MYFLVAQRQPQSTFYFIYFQTLISQRACMFLHGYTWLFSLAVVIGAYHVLSVLQSKVYF